MRRSCSSNAFVPIAGQPQDTRQANHIRIPGQWVQNEGLGTPWQALASTFRQFLGPTSARASTGTGHRVSENTHTHTLAPRQVQSAFGSNSSTSWADAVPSLRCAAPALHLYPPSPARAPKSHPTPPMASAQQLLCCCNCLGGSHTSAWASGRAAPVPPPPEQPLRHFQGGISTASAPSPGGWAAPVQQPPGQRLHQRVVGQ